MVWWILATQINNLLKKELSPLEATRAKLLTLSFVGTYKRYGGVHAEARSGPKPFVWRRMVDYIILSHELQPLDQQLNY